MIDYLTEWLALWTPVIGFEYGIIGGVIVALIAIGFTSMAGSLSTKFVRTGQSLEVLLRRLFRRPHGLLGGA
jgi:hypothetical protein